jgi:hypothetical protein
MRAGKPHPRAKAALAKARSFLRGTLDARDLAAVAKRVKRPDLREMASEMEDFDGDAMLVEGDLDVDGDFRTSDAGAIWSPGCASANRSCVELHLMLNLVWMPTPRASTTRSCGARPDHLRADAAPSP